MLRKSKDFRDGYTYTNFKGNTVVVPPSLLHNEHTTIHRHEIDEFLHEPQAPTVIDNEGRQWHHKLNYGFKVSGEYQHASDLALHFLGDHAQHTHDNPMVSPFGHHIVFHPDQRSIDRLGYKKALMEYALHTITQTKNGTHEHRLFDRDKSRNFHMIKEVIQHADDFKEENGKVTYWKVIKQGNKRGTLVLLEMQKEGDDLLPKVMRYKTLMPNHKMPGKVTPTTNPIAVGFVPAQTDGEASQVDGLAKAIILKAEQKFNKSLRPGLWLLKSCKPSVATSATDIEAGGHSGKQLAGGSPEIVLEKSLAGTTELFKGLGTSSASGTTFDIAFHNTLQKSESPSGKVKAPVQNDLVKSLVGTHRLRKSIVPIHGYLKNSGKLVSNYSQNRIVQAAAPFRHTLDRFTTLITEKRNLSAEHLTKDALYTAHGNEMKAIGEVRPEIVDTLGLTDSHIYTGEGYFLDHHFNHHPNLPVVMYMTIPDVLMNPDEVVKDTRFDRIETYAFIRKYNWHHSVVIDAAKVDGQLILYKTFFSQKKKPYKGVTPVWQKSIKGREDYISSIDPDTLGKSAPGGSRFSALLPFCKTIPNLKNDVHKSLRPGLLLLKSRKPSVASRPADIEAGGHNGEQLAGGSPEIVLEKVLPARRNFSKDSEPAAQVEQPLISLFITPSRNQNHHLRK